MVSRAWVSTIGKTDLPLTLFGDLQYIAYQVERGDGGYEHLQVYCEFSKPQRITGVARHLGVALTDARGYSFWAAPRRGTQEQAIEYCTSNFYCKLHKCGDNGDSYCNCEGAASKGRVRGPVEIGEKAARRGGRRPNDIVAQVGHLREAVLEGMSRRDAMEQFPALMMRYPRYVDNIFMHAAQTTVKEPPAVYWLHGDTGTGKSKIAAAVFPRDSYYKPPDTRWFDGYDGHRVVIINDLRKSTFSFSYLLELLDRYHIQVEHKGGHVAFTPRVIIITCSKSAEVLWGHIAGEANENVQQLVRRIKREVLFPLSRPQELELLASMRDDVRSSASSGDAFPTWDGVSDPYSICAQSPSRSPAE